MKVASMISRQGFGQHHSRNVRWPDSTSAQLGEASTLSGKRTDSAAVENQVHALRLPFFLCFGAVESIESAQAVAADASSGPIGPSSASSRAR